MAQLELAVQRYEAALRDVDPATLAETPRETLGMLLARDAVQAALDDPETPGPDADLALRIADADRVLHRLQGPLSTVEAVDEWRDALGKDESAWWWEPASELELGQNTGWRDNVANVLTVVFLALATSFTVGIFQAFSSDGISWTETFGTLLQASGLALVGSGTLTQRGRRRVAQLLSRWGISRKLQAEVMCASAAALAAVLWAAHDRVLPDWFEHAGERAYDAGELRQAEEDFRRALALGQEPAHVLLYLGRIRETLEDHDAARGYYEQALLAGDPHAFNYLGRLLLSSADPQPTQAKALLQLGLQRALAAGAATEDRELEMDLRRNLAWALMMEIEAGGPAPSDAPARIRKLLEKVNELEMELGDTPRIDQDMEDCLLAHHLTSLGEPTLARDHRKRCLEHARPETIGEYRFLLERLVPTCPLTIDTSAVIKMGGYAADELQVACEELGEAGPG